MNRWDNPCYFLGNFIPAAQWAVHCWQRGVSWI